MTGIALGRIGLTSAFGSDQHVSVLGASTEAIEQDFDYLLI
jgi:hypothetical protein